MDNNEKNNLVKQGNEAFEKHNWKEAIYFFGQASLIKNDFAINKKIVISLFKIGKFDDAVEQSSLFLDEYLNNEEDMNLLFDIFIGAKEFLQANQLLNLIKNNKEIINKVRNAEIEYQKNNLLEIKNQEKDLMSLVIMPIGIQASKIRDMKHLPLNNYLKISENLLLNPYLHPLLKNEITENLIKLKINKEYTISFFGELKKFNPSSLKSLFVSKKYIEIKELLKKKLETYSDVEYNLLLNEFSLYISMLHPFIDQIVTYPNEWIDIYLNKYEKKDIKLTQNGEMIEKWLDKFEKLLNNFNE
ncbi:hypothetical protein [Companilactobacillus sp. DQM5]|uniref:hypothetical protein n=1 Tax=Companilactobacillus sp. DQM5 TaxID=3463359 RepID=UPI004058E7A8